MWSPTHIQVTVLRAKGLLTKGKNATNNCFVTIGLGKEKYQTSLKEKVPSNVDWHEECELKIPDQGNRAELVLTCLHRNNLGIDEFLGQAILPLNEMDVYDRPRSRWFKLESKPGKEKKKERGELEVRISFVVKSGSLTDLRKKEKHKSSVGQLASSVGGSLLSIGTIEKRKSLSKIAKSIGSKMHLPGSGGGGSGSGKKKKNKEIDTDSFTGSFSSIETPNSGRRGRYGQRIGEADPGVISEDEDEFVFDNLSHKSSGSSLNIRSGLQNYNAPIASSPMLLHGKEDESLRSRILPPSKPPRNAANESPPKVDEWEAKLYGKHGMDGSGGGGGLGVVGGTDSLKRRSWETSRVPLPQNNNSSNSSNSAEEAEETESARDFKEAVEAEEKLQAVAASDVTTMTTTTTTTTAFKESVLARASLDRENKSTTETPFSTPQKETKFFPEIKQRRLENLVNGSAVDQQSSTAPSTPVSRRSNEHITSPQATQTFTEAEKQSQKSAMSRSATMECLSQKDSAPIAVPASFSASNTNLAKDDKDTEKDTPPTAAAAAGKTTEKRNRFSKYKYFNKRDKNDFNFDDNNYSPIPSERIIIGHEKSSSHVPRSEISAALEKKYDGKSREELMIIAHGMETEALIQRQRVKELEDYLDNLLLRVMETHPKILQNPYSQRTTLAKSG